MNNELNELNEQIYIPILHHYAQACNVMTKEWMQNSWLIVHKNHFRSCDDEPLRDNISGVTTDKAINW